MKRLKVLTMFQEIHLLVLFISSFTVSLTPSINTPEYSNDFMILIISFISPFEINKINLFPALTAPFPLIFLSSLFITFQVKLLTTPGKLFVSAFFPKIPNREPKYLTD